MSRSILTATCAGMLMIALPAAAQDAGLFGNRLPTLFKLPWK